MRLSRFALGALAAGASAHAGNARVLNLSHYDPATPDFRAIHAAGVQGVIHEATYPPGTGDPAYGARQAQATHAGLLWGAYHFGNATDPVHQADQFADFVAREAHLDAAPAGGVLMILDFEQNTHYPGGTMSVPQAIIFLERVRERTGHYPGLYSNENRVHQVLNNPVLPDASKDALRKTWLWIANYHRQPEFFKPWNRWSLWQYTGDGVCEMPRSSYPTSVANVHRAELNIFEGGRGELARFWHEHAWVP